jgi:hypothetical protein
VIRTFWFAAFCLAGLGGLLATRVTASMAFSGESILDPAVLGEALAQERPTNQTPTNQTLAIDMPTRDTLTKADRLDVAYLPVAMVMIAEAPAEPIAVPETKPDANAGADLQRSAALHVHRSSVMLPRPRPKIRPAKISHAAKPVVEVKTCTPPEGLSVLLMALANQPRCG